MGRTIPRKQIQAFENRIYNQLNQTVKQKIKKWSVSVSTQLGNPGEVRQARRLGSHLARRHQRHRSWTPRDPSSTDLPGPFAGAQSHRHPLCNSSVSINQSPPLYLFSLSNSSRCPHKILKALHVRLHFPGPKTGDLAPAAVSRRWPSRSRWAADLPMRACFLHVTRGLLPLLAASRPPFALRNRVVLILLNLSARLPSKNTSFPERHHPGSPPASPDTLSVSFAASCPSPCLYT